MRYESYPGPLGPEWMMMHGPADGPRVLILTPLFNEANGTRALVVDMARRLGEAGVGSAIPDLPGTGESLHPLPSVGWNHWREAVASAGRCLGTHDVVAVRGGALLDDAAPARSCLRFAPASGSSLLRQLERAQMISDKEAGRVPAVSGTIALAGYHLAPGFVADLRGAEPAQPTVPLRTLPFEGPGLPPWRRAEPAGDPVLAARLAQDISTWIRSCDA